MTQSTIADNKFFTPFPKSVDISNLPTQFTFPFDYKPHPLCEYASQELQAYLTDTE